MSYSYVKTVFPNFSASIYDTKLYDTIESTTVPNELLSSESTIQEDYGIINDKKNSNIETFVDNLKFYSSPVPINTSINAKVSNSKDIEDVNHQDYSNHILECSNCKDLISKQLNLDIDKIRNEEIMELISFIMFGIFILLLIDSKKN